MKYIFPALVSLVLLSCNNNKKTAGSSEEPGSVPTQIAQKLLGSFVGDFGTNKITLLITGLHNDTIKGRSIVGGNDRPFMGTYKEADGVYTINVREPGDDPNDGMFEFAINSADLNMLSGTWQPYDKGIEAKHYALNRRSFVYRTDVGDYPEASQRELSATEVENYSGPELAYMRNEIFARHGYCFRKRDMRDTFEELDWYIPDNVDVRDKLTAIEKKNLALIKRYEKYVEEYGDEYGR